MKTLNIYSEYTKNSTVGSVKSNISNVPDKNRELVLKHLKTADIKAVIPGILIDVVDGKRINSEWVLFSDGVYEWTSDITYYYEKYNLILPQDFINHVCMLSN